MGKKALKRKAGKGDDMGILRKVGAYKGINVMPAVGGRLNRPQSNWRSAKKIKTVNAFNGHRPRSSCIAPEIQKNLSGMAESFYGASPRSKFFWVNQTRVHEDHYRDPLGTSYI